MNLTRHIWASPSAQDKFRKLLDSGKTISEYLEDVIGKLAEDDRKGWAEAVSQAVPIIADSAGEIAAELPFVKIAYKLAQKWTELNDPYEIGAVACTLAYQQAVHDAIEQTWTSAIGFNRVLQIDRRVAKQIRDLAVPEGADLSTFSYEHAILHPFIRRADRVLEAALHAGGFTPELQRRIFHLVHEKFIEALKKILTGKEAGEKYASFKDRLTEGTQENRARAALAAHAEYQRELFEQQPLFKYEPFALKEVYIETECGELTWGEIKEKSKSRPQPAEAASGPSDFSPYNEHCAERKDLLKSVMEKIEDRSFKEAIIIQGVAGSGKSSFTLRLGLELMKKGFIPIRIRFKRLSLEDSIIEALENAIELDDEDSQSERRLLASEGILLNGRVFDETPYDAGGNQSRFVLILDGWDELSVGSNETFKTKVASVLERIRAQFIDGSRHNLRVRVVITGRPTPDIGESGALRNATPIFTLWPLRPDHLHQFISRLHAATLNPTLPIPDGEQTAWRVADFAKFAPIIDRYRETFENSRNRQENDDQNRSLEVLEYPLLGYLAVRVMSQMPDDSNLDALVERPSRLYRQLTDLTCEGAAKSPDDRRDRDSEREGWWRLYGSELRHLICQTAAAITVTGEEQISFRELEARIDYLNPNDQMALESSANRAASRNPLSKLMVSFYFKGGHTDLGCEFAHKSFREYLYAEAVVATLKRFALKMPNRPAPPRARPWIDFERNHDPRYDFSREMIQILGGQWLTPEVISHLEYLISWEIERAANLATEDDFGQPTEPISFEEWRAIRDGLADLWEWWVDKAHSRTQSRRGERGREYRPEASAVQTLIEEWFIPMPWDPARPIAYRSVNSIDACLGDALFYLCALVHFRVAVSDGFDASLLQNDEVLSTGRPGHHKHQIIVSHKTGSWTFFRLAQTPAQISSHLISRINSVSGRPLGLFPGRIYGNAVYFLNAYLPGASLSGASLSGAYLSRANLARANLSHANLSGTNLSDANLARVSLLRANLSGANLSGASLSGANLAGVSLSGANLSGAFLHFANLRNARYQWEQIEAAHINKGTIVSPEFEELKQQKLKKQREIEPDS